VGGQKGGGDEVMKEGQRERGREVTAGRGNHERERWRLGREELEVIEKGGRDEKRR